MAAAQELAYSTLKEKYQASDVPMHRFGFTQAQRLLDKPLSVASLGRAAAKGAQKEAAVASLAAFKLSDTILSTDLSGIFTGIFKTDTFIVAWSVWHYVSAVCAAVLMVMAASVIPARRAARLEPGDVIRGTGQ